MASLRLRKRHLKSRLGCLQCKQRKIKCDEVKPKCGPCTTSRRDCSYTIYEPLPETVETTEYDILDLELLHHFILSTHATLSNNPELQRFYQVEFVEASFEADYIRHGLLAFSAFHKTYELRHQAEEDDETFTNQKAKMQELGSSGSTEKYLVAAYRHQDVAIRAFRQALTCFSVENCHYLFIFQLVLVLTVLSRIPDQCSSADDDAPPSTSLAAIIPRLQESFTLMRGMYPIFVAPEIFPIIRDGPMGGILRAIMKVEQQVDVEAEEALENLAEMFKAVGAPETHSFCLDTIEKLKMSFAIAAKNNDLPTPFIFVAHWKQEFMQAIENRQIEALVLLCFWACLFKRLQWSWVTKGWPLSILTAVAPVLDEKWRPALRWPAQRLGLDYIALFNGEEAL